MRAFIFGAGVQGAAVVNATATTVLLEALATAPAFVPRGVFDLIYNRRIRSVSHPRAMVC